MKKNISFGFFLFAALSASVLALTACGSPDNSPGTENVTISITVNNADYGTAAGGGTFAKGASVTLTATAQAGYVFVNWTDGGSAVSSDNTYIFTASADRALTANFKAEEAPPHVHDDGAWVTTSEPDCTGAGTKELRCTVCEAVLDTQTIPATGHDGGAWMTTSAPNCTEAGTKELRCTVCESVLDTQIISALGHNWSEWEVTKQPAGAANGEETRVCRNDASHIEERPVSAPGTEGLAYTLINGDTAYEVSKGTAGTNGAVVIQAIYEGLPVTSIGNSAFLNCGGLTDIVIPGSVASIGSGAFSGCSGLTELTLTDSVTSIGAGAFTGCTKLGITWAYSAALPINTISAYLTDIIFPAGITAIPADAFQNCVKLLSVTIPGSVISIGSGAFSGCAGLTELAVPDSVTSIGAGAFIGCTELGITWAYSAALPINTISAYLTDIIFPAGITAISADAFQNCEKLLSVTIPDSIISIGSGAFSGCSGLTELTIPGSVTSIGAGAFTGCTELGITWTYNAALPVSAISPYLTDVIFPAGITAIAADAFQNCVKLLSVTIPDSIISIGNSAFSGCTGLTDINYNATSCVDFTSTNNVFYNAGINGTGINVRFGVNVAKIPAFLFRPATSGFPKIASVTFAEGSHLTTIGTYAFYDCRNLTNITIPSEVTAIGTYSFYNCDKLTSINFNATNCADFTSTNNNVFYNAGINGTGVSVRIGANVKNIPAYLFHPTATNYPKITSVTFDADGQLTAIGRNAFSGCHNLTSIAIPSGVTDIGTSAFSSCNELISVTFGENSLLTSIESSMFQGCSKLANIIIPSGVTSIGNFAFYNCSALARVYYCGADRAAWNRISIEGSYNDPITNLAESARYYYSATRPSGAGNYWHYGEDGFTPVLW